MSTSANNLSSKADRSQTSDDSTSKHAHPFFWITGPAGTGKSRTLARETYRLQSEWAITDDTITVITPMLSSVSVLTDALNHEAVLAGYPFNVLTPVTPDQWALTQLKRFSSFIDKKTPTPPATTGTKTLNSISDAFEQLPYALHRLQRQDAEALIHHLISSTPQQWHPAITQQDSPSILLSLFDYALTEQTQHWLAALNTPEKKHTFNSTTFFTLPGSHPNDIMLCQQLAELYHLFSHHTFSKGMLLPVQINALCQYLLSQPIVQKTLQHDIKLLVIDDVHRLQPNQYNLLYGLATIAPMLVSSLAEPLFNAWQPDGFNTLKTITTSANATPTFIPLTLSHRNNEPLMTCLNTLYQRHQLPIFWESDTTKPTKTPTLPITFLRPTDTLQEITWLAHIINQHRLNTIANATQALPICILASSKKEKHRLITALLDEGIQVNALLPDDQSRVLEHYFYHALQVVHLATRANVISSGITNTTTPIGIDTIKTLNMHTWQCLQILYPNQQSSTPFTSEIQTNLNNDTVLLNSKSELLKPLLAPLIECITAYQHNQSVYQLCWQLFHVLQPLQQHRGLVDNTTGTFLGLFMQALQQHETSATHLGIEQPLWHILNLFESLWRDALNQDITNNQSNLTVDVLTPAEAWGRSASCVIIPSLTQYNAERFSGFISHQANTSNQTPFAEILFEHYNTTIEKNTVHATNIDHLSVLVLSHVMAQAVISTEASADTTALPSVILSCPIESMEANQHQVTEVIPANIVTDLIDILHPDTSEWPSNQFNLHADDLQQTNGLNTKKTTSVKSKLWTTLEKQILTNLYNTDDILRLSPSSLNTYIKCPRQFYYKSILRLPEDDSSAASIGSLVHTMLENVNKHVNEESLYTSDRIINECNHFFDALTSTVKQTELINTEQYKPHDFENVLRLSKLDQHQLKDKLLRSFEDLANKGYFDRYGALPTILPEIKLNEFEVEGVDRTVFHGRVDAVIQKQNSTGWDAIDYKHYGEGKFSTKPDTCQSNFVKILNPLPDDAETHEDAFFKFMNSDASYPYDYQLPLYALGLSSPSNAGVVNGTLNQVMLQLVRPELEKTPSNGSIALTLSVHDILEKQGQLAHDINTWISKPLLAASDLKGIPDDTKCGYCSFSGICPDAFEVSDSDSGDAN